MKALSDITAKVAKQNFSRKYIALGRIVNHWSEIVGEKLAAKAIPVKLHYRGKNKKNLNVTLDIAVSSADATLLHYQKDLILERMNNVFGERWVTALRFVQTATNTNQGFGENFGKKPKSKKALDAYDQEHLKTQLDKIEDGELLERLRSLGEAVIIEGKET